MARLARVVAVGVPHHLTQRGNNRQSTFFDDDDRLAYCRLLDEQCSREGVRLLGYCLMSNHVHLVAIPERSESFARGLGPGAPISTPARCTNAGARRDTCGRTAFSRVRSTATIFGPRRGMSISIRCGRS